LHNTNYKNSKLNKNTLNNLKITKQPLKNPKPPGICRNSDEEGF
jgi:hypothetical protein